MADKRTPPAPAERAGVTNTAELEAKSRDAREAWAKAPASSAPVETPPAPPATPPVETPPAEPATPPAESPAAPPPGATAAEVEEFIEALIREAEGDKPAEVLKIPKAARIPHKVNGEIVYRPAHEALTSSMREQDYITKTTEVAAARRELEQHAARLIADRARMEAREQWIKDERTRLREAQKSPEAWERYQNHLRLMEEDPEYRKTFDDALEGRERRAEDAASEAADRQDMVAAGVAQAAEWILEIGKEPAFEAVDLDRVREIYAQQLERGQATLDEAAVRGIFTREAQYLSSSLTPLQSRIAELEAQVAKLTATDPAAAHNKATQHALDRAKVPPVTTGSPPAPAATPKKMAPFGPRDLPDRNREWASRRD